MGLKENIIDSMRILDEDQVIATVKTAVAEKVDRLEIIDWLNLGMKEVGILYEKEEYYLVELIMSEIIFTAVLNLEDFKNWAGSESGQPIGSMVVGTVNGDNHDIGKNIFKSMMAASNIQVHDLGVDVPAEAFLEAVKNYQPDILALSGILTSSLDEFYQIVTLLKEAGLRDSLKIVIGCPELSSETAKKIGADFVTSDTGAGKTWCVNWIREKSQQ